MSITSRDYFDEVSLGEKHEEALRLALLNDTEFAEEEYPVLLTAPGSTANSWATGSCRPIFPARVETASTAA